MKPCKRTRSREETDALAEHASTSIGTSGGARERTSACARAQARLVPRLRPRQRQGRGCLRRLLLVAVLALALAPARAVAPPRATGLLLGTTGGEDKATGRRFLDIPASRITLQSPLTFEIWLKANAVAGGGGRATSGHFFDFGSFASPNAFNNIYAALCSCAVASCCTSETSAAKAALRLVYYEGTVLKASLTVFQASPLDVGAWAHVVLVATGTQLLAYRDGAAQEAQAMPAVAALPRALGYLGRSTALESSDGFAANVAVSSFRVFSAALSAGEVASAFAGSSVGQPKYMEFTFDGCPEASNGTTADTGGRGLHATLVGDAWLLLCPVRLASALAADPRTLLFSAAFAAGQGVASVAVACGGPGGPYALSLPAADDAAGGLPITLDLGEDGISYAGAYVLTCNATFATSGGSILVSAPRAVTVPPGNAIAAQSALMPSRDPGAANTFLRVVSAVSASQNVKIVFAALMPGYMLGSRGAVHRLGVITRSKEAYAYCEYDLDAARCNFVVALADVLQGAMPTDFSYTSYTPWPAKDPDARFAPSDLPSFKADTGGWTGAAGWLSGPYEQRASLLGPQVGPLLKRAADCTGATPALPAPACTKGDADCYACLAHAAQRWAAYAYGGCSPAPYGPVRDWPAGTCAAAGPYDFVTAAGAFTHDFRHLRASYERTFYESAV